MNLSINDIDDLLSAIREAQNELCCGDGFPEATAYNERLNVLSERLKAQRVVFELAIEQAVCNNS